MKDVLNFEVKSGLKNIIGRDLITDDNIAIFELVKNSYDAFANNVIITFEENKIIIADNGVGMAFNDLLEKWLAVAYSNKKDQNTKETKEIKRESYRDNIPARHHYAGAKGIGRFSCDRLGEKLILTTRKINTEDTERLTIDWTKYEDNSKKNFREIKIPHEKIACEKNIFPYNSRHGTILEIDNIGTWDGDKIISLKHSLEKLINPFSDFETEEFCIEIVCLHKLDEDDQPDKDGSPKNERNKINGKINNSIIRVLNIKTTQIQIVINNEIMESKLIDRGALIYHIKQKNSYSEIIDNLKIDLYFMNRSAKINFKNVMGIDLVNYGSVFLFKNGFRVQPYGEINDDSWGLNWRSQQGYKRFLSSRDLFGQVNIITDNTQEFNEVSSRDGGLKKTVGYYNLMDLFKNKALIPLERYVVGVLWGEGFLRNKYFTTNDEGIKFRGLLKDKDKDSDDMSIAISNVGSKIDFIKLIKELADDNDIKIIDFNKNLIDVVNENLRIVKPKFLADLERIVETTGDKKLKQKLSQTEKQFKKLQEEKTAAEKKAVDEEQSRKEAEKKAIAEEEKRKEAEIKARKAKEEKLKAELEKEKAEKARLWAENKKLLAEQKAKDEEDKRIAAEEDLEKEVKKGIFQRSIIGKEKEQIMGLQHQIKHSASRIITNTKDLSIFIRDIKIRDINEKYKKFLSVILKESEKIESIAKFVTNANFNLSSSEITEDIVEFISDYIQETQLFIKSKMKISIKNRDGIKYRLEFRPLEITILIDNLINNSEKAEAKQFNIEFETGNKNLDIIISDNGKGIPEKYISRIFDFGFTTTDGSGIGLYNVLSIIKGLKGEIKVVSKETQGTTFTLTL
jgi:signal transduction histidine kinase